MKMIDELRSNILELHAELKSVRAENEGKSKVEVGPSQ